MRFERDAATGSRQPRQDQVAPRGRAHQCQCAERDQRGRRQGVLLDQCRCRRGASLGIRPGRGRGRGARHSRRHHRDGGADRRAQGRRAATTAANSQPRHAGRAAGPCPQAAAAGRRPIADGAAVRDSGRRGRDRGRLRQGRRRQVHDRAQSCAGPARSRPQGRAARCRHLRPLGAAADRPPPEAGAGRRAQDDSAQAFRPGHHVDRLPGGGRDRDDLARADGDVGGDADAARRRMGRARRPRRRHAARHR